MNSIFDLEKIENRLNELKEMPSFIPNEDELKFSATQDNKTFIYFVIRNGEPIYYDTKTIKD